VTESLANFAVTQINIFVLPAGGSSLARFLDTQLILIATNGAVCVVLSVLWFSGM
jgi:hypothetical protein